MKVITFYSLALPLNLNRGDNQNRSNLSSTATQQPLSTPSNVESNPGEQSTTIGASNLNEIAIADDATQLLLTRLGILRRKYFLNTFRIRCY